MLVYVLLRLVEKLADCTFSQESRNPEKMPLTGMLHYIYICCFTVSFMSVVYVCRGHTVIKHLRRQHVLQHS